MKTQVLAPLPAAIVLVVAMLCGGPPAESKTPSAKAPAKVAGGLTLQQIENAVFRLPPEIGDEPDAMIKLTDGTYQDGDMTVQLEKVAFGDLNGDGLPDAAAVYYWNGGGSGYFNRLTVFINKKGVPVCIQPKVIGDRVGIKGLQIKSGQIILNVLSHGPTDGACCPTVKRTARYHLSRGELIGPDSLYE